MSLNNRRGKQYRGIGRKLTALNRIAAHSDALCLDIPKN